MTHWKLILIFILFSIVCIVRESRLVLRKKSLSIINLFGYMYGLTYGVLPAMVIWLYEEKRINLSHSYYKIDYTQTGIYNLVIWFVCSVISYVILQIFYNIPFSRKEFLQEKDSNKKVYSLNTLQWCVIYSFLIGIVSIYLWTRAYGGIFQLIAIADVVRDGEGKIINSMAFFLRPAKLMFIVSFMSLFLIKQNHNKGINVIFLIVSVISSYLILLAQDGRMAMVVYFVTLFLVAFDFMTTGKLNRKKLFMLLLLAIVAMMIILKMDDFTYYIRNEIVKKSRNDESVYETVFSEFSYIITGCQHIVAICRESGSPFLIIQDILRGIFAWIPRGMIPFELINVWDYNTEICTIGRTLYGQLPCDFITTSLYDLSFSGPIIFPMFWGQIIRWIDKKHENNTFPLFDVLYYSFGMSVLRLVNYCLLYDFIMGMFHIALAALIYAVCTKIHKRQQIM